PVAGPSAAPGVTGSARPSLAGRPAGAGVKRPGRATPPTASDSATPAPSASDAAEEPVRSRTATDERRRDGRYHGQGAVPDVVPEGDSHGAVPPAADPSHTAWEPRGRAAETGVDRRVPVLTLGVGLTLMGLGLGFLGVRVRRV
ncbi:hypothetical protein AB0N23_03395, partial [Streptomyces sp. NPDC052644]